MKSRKKETKKPKQKKKSKVKPAPIKEPTPGLVAGPEDEPTAATMTKKNIAKARLKVAN